MKNFDFKPRLIRWVFLLQEFDLAIKDKFEMENVVADHLSRQDPKVTPTKELKIGDSFPDDQLLVISLQATPWFADLVNFRVCGVRPPGLLSYQ